jgi:NAD(P)-dependent dehydrogenase (short-subunit alcohol dehydrogenase family)
MLSRLLAAELGPFGVRSNVVNPGFVESNMTRASYADPQVTARRAGMVALGRIGQPRDIAEVVLFLASPAAAYVTGAELLVDGGLAQNLFARVPRGS